MAITRNLYVAPGSRLRTSTESFDGEMLSAATSQSLFLPMRLYSTLKEVMGEPPFALGIQVTYTDVSEAVEMVGRSGASGTPLCRAGSWITTPKLVLLLSSIAVCLGTPTG